MACESTFGTKNTILIEPGIYICKTHTGQIVCVGEMKQMIK